MRGVVATPDCAGRNRVHDPVQWRLVYTPYETSKRAVIRQWTVYGSYNSIVAITGHPSPYMEANARLIAAAPDAIATCHAVMDWWAEHKYDVDEYDAGGGYMDATNRYDTEPEFVTLARAAIARATGAA